MTNNSEIIVSLQIESKRKMEHVNELIRLLEMHENHSMPLNRAAMHLQNTCTTFFDEKRPLSFWQKTIKAIVKENHGVFYLDAENVLRFNPNRASQLSLDFSDEEPEFIEEQKKPVDCFQMGLFD